VNNINNSNNIDANNNMQDDYPKTRKIRHRATRTTDKYPDNVVDGNQMYNFNSDQTVELQLGKQNQGKSSIVAGSEVVVESIQNNNFAIFIFRNRGVRHPSKKFVAVILI
jgi:hypothetical protein